MDVLDKLEALFAVILAITMGNLMAMTLWTAIGYGKK